MHRVSETVKQPYRSKVRAEAALRTRRLIREAAADLFVRNGVAATTMREVAAEAGVAERTVYTAFPNKAALFKEVLDVAVAGDEEPVPVADRPVFTAALTGSDPARVADLVAESAVVIMERAGDLMMTAVESAGADPEMRAIDDHSTTMMAVNMLAMARAWQGAGLLREGVPPQQAADILVTLLSPHAHHLLRRVRGWEPSRYRSWVSDTVARTLLRPAP